MKLTFSARNRTLGPLDVVGLVGLGGLLVGRYVSVARLVPFWGCAFRRITGWPCPGCGLTRVAERVGHFNLTGALVANPLGTLAALAFALAAVWTVLHLVFRLPTPQLSLSDADWTRLRNVALGALAVNYLAVIVMWRHGLW